MAITRCQANITIKDAKGETAVMQLWLPAASTSVEVSTYLTTFSTIVNTLTGGQIVAMSYTYSIDLPGGLRTAPLADSDVEEGAVFVFADATRLISKIRVPTFKETYLVPATALVDQTNADVTTFKNQIIAGLAGTNPTTISGSDITQLLSAKEQFKRSRR